MNALTADCRHCGRTIVQDPGGGWADPKATGDDSVWRETCDQHDDFVAKHEPVELPEEGMTRCYCGAKYWDGNKCHSCGATWDGTDQTGD